MAGSPQLIKLLVATFILIASASSETTKLKSNPDGNFAIGFVKGYISSGKYGVIVPKGDEDDKREVQIRGAGVRDSIYMEFNKHTIVFSDWQGMFMLGDAVYTDKLGTLYFVRSDKKCIKKVYKLQLGEVQVIDKEKLDKGQCDAVRAKVEKALSHYLTTPFKYLLPTAPLKLQKTPGFPGGDFFTGIKQGTIHCGQHTVEVPSGDEDKDKLIKIKAPGVSDEIKMIFDSDTKVFCSWDGLLYLGNKVFSVESKTLIIKKSDGACVKKIYDTHGGEIVVKHSTMLKEEDCFLIKSKAFSSMQQLLKPEKVVDEEIRKQTVKSDSVKSQSQLVPEKSDAKDASVQIKAINIQPQESQKEAPPPIHVTSTVVIPKQTPPPSQFVPVISSNPTIVAPLPASQLYTFQNGNQAQAQRVITLSPSDVNILTGRAVSTQAPASFVTMQSEPSPINTVLIQPTNLPNQPVQYGNTISSVPNDYTLGGDNKVVNIQKNDIDLDSGNSPYMLNSFDPANQIVVPEGYVRVARSIAQNAQPGNIFNNQETTIDASAIAKAREGTSPTNIIGIQKSNILSPLGANGLPLTSDMKATQITTVTIPPNNKGPSSSSSQYNGNKGEQQLFIKTNVIMDQDSKPQQPPNTILLTPIAPQTVKLVSQPSGQGQVVNVQKNNVNLNEPGKVVNVQKNIIDLQNFQTQQNSKILNLQENDVNMDQPSEVKNIQINRSTMKTQNVPIIFKESTPTVLLRVGRSISSPSKVLNFQDNNLNLDSTSDVRNIQKNHINIKEPNSDYILAQPSPNVLLRVGRSISPNVYVQKLPVAGPQNVLNYQDNNINSNGASEIKNIQKNNIVEKSKSGSILLEDKTPDILIRAGRSIPARFVLQNLNVPLRKIVNFQKNDVSLNGVGDIRNIQKNNVGIKPVTTPILIQKMAPNVLVRVAREIPNDVYVQSVQVPDIKKILNYQDNNVNLEGDGEIKNIQKNKVAAKSINSPIILKSSPNVLVRVAREIPQNVYVQRGSPPVNNVLNLQDNDLTLDGQGDVKNIQKNHVNVKSGKSAYILEKTLPDVLVRVARNVQQQQGQNTVYQPNNIVTLQGNDVIAPIGANGLAIMPNVKSSQLTKLTIPPQQGSNSPPQQMFIKTNVLLKQNEAQANQGVPIYQTAQSPPLSVSNRPTFVKLIPSSQTLLLPSSTVQPSGQTLYVKTGNPQELLSATPQQQPPQVYRYTNEPSPQSVSNIQLNNVDQNTPTVPVSQQNPSMVRVGPYFVVPAKTQPTSSIHFYPNGAGKVKTSIPFTSGGNAAVIVNAPPSTLNDPSTQGHIPVTLMKDLTMLKHMYNPSSMIVNIAESTNFHKK